MLGDNIKALRKKNGYSQQDLADKLNVSRQTISSWEVNRTEPTMGNIEMMSIIFHCNKSDLIDGVSNAIQEVYSFGEDVLPVDHIKNISDTKKELMNVVSDMSDEQAGATLDFVRRLEAYARHFIDRE